MKVIVFSYNRESMLRSLVGHLEANDMDYHIIDDGSDYDLSQFVPDDRFTRFKNGGKEKFWIKFAAAFDICKLSRHDDFLFMPDDFEDINIELLEGIAEGWWNKIYCMNIINDGREFCWGHHRKGLKSIPFDIDNMAYEVGFCDCGFITNRRTIQHVNIDPVPSSWFDRPDKSSGVGHQLTVKFRDMGVPMMKPKNSLAKHGNHESMMHGNHRKDVELKSK